MKQPLRVHMIAGSEEYDAAASLEEMARHLEALGLARCTLSCAEDRGDDVPELERLHDADVVLVFCRRVTLPPSQLAMLKAWCDAGRPVVGVRTASHAFRNWPEFDREVLGGDYQGHGPEAAVTVAPEAGQLQHPIVLGLSAWGRVDKVYRNPQLAADAQVLLRAADGADAGTPLAWCRTRSATDRAPADGWHGGRVFYTSMGHPHDFAEPRYLGLLTRALQWTAGTTPEAKVTRTQGAGWAFAPLADLPAVPCPCGTTRRAFTDDPARTASIHLVDISTDARTHYHRRLTEIYLVLEGSGHLELDGELIPVKPLDAILIRPGCRHRAVGRLRIVNIPVPAFDPDDEWFD